MSSRFSKARRIDEILGEVLKNLPRTKEPGEEGILAVWTDIVGEGIARRTSPGAFRDGILFVKVTSSTWVQELEFMKDEFDLPSAIDNDANAAAYGEYWAGAGREVSAQCRLLRVRGRRGQSDRQVQGQSIGLLRRRRRGRQRRRGSRVRRTGRHPVAARKIPRSPELNFTVFNNENRLAAYDIRQL